jgi:formylglycine-generating enzyme required for sulfatase activity
MHLNSLRVPFLASFSLGTLALSTIAQASAAVAPKAQAQPAATPKAPAAKNDDVQGLPTFLLPVPEGQVEIGLSTQQLVDAARQAVNPRRPADADAKKVTDAMRRTASALGKRKVPVPQFLLGKWNVKCSEYDVFVQARRKAGLKQRPPYLQWRYGREDDYTAKLPEINQAFPKMKEGPVLFWERHGQDLPYELPKQDVAVTGVSWREANDFAASIGMRLPTEIEWMRAARGDGTNVWPCSDPKDPATDVYTEELPRKLRMVNSRDQVLKPTGTVATATGPFGHLDMFGQVWQLMGEIGFRPINGTEVFAEEWKRLQKDKVGQLLQAAPTWDDERVISKGGSYLSAGEPIQLLLDARAPVQTIDVMEALGFRLAKSLRPGYDLLFSSIRGAYNRGQFTIDQEPDLTALVGAERYELTANSFPSEYHGVALAPVNFLSRDKNADLAKLLDKAESTPLLFATFVTTMPAVAGKVPPGSYSLLFRKGGRPKELVEAVKAGHKELAAAAKRGKDEEPQDDKKDAKKNAWREVVTRYGLTDKDLESKDVADGNVKFVRIDEFEVPIEEDTILVHGFDGRVVATIPASQKPANGAPAASTLRLEATADGKSMVKFQFVAPLSQGNPKKVATFQVTIPLDRAAPTADKPWRLPPQ